MPDSASRLLRLLGLLQRRPAWSGPELSAALGVDARTVRRDVERLRNLGYQVDASPGTGGGYRLGVGAQVPPLLLDEEEATAVAVVLGVMASVAVPGVERGALAALTKLDRLLPPGSGGSWCPYGRPRWLYSPGWKRFRPNSWFRLPGPVTCTNA